jgi:hypothetical protein
MTDDKSLLRAPPDYSNPDRYREGSNGAVFDRETGRIVTLDPSRNPYAITPENAREMHKRRKQLDRIARMRGLALGIGIELPEDAAIEQIAGAAHSAVEALTAHMTKVFLKSNNVRGLAEAYSKLIAALQDDDEGEDGARNDHLPRVLVLLAEIGRRRESGDVIDAESDR